MSKLSRRFYGVLFAAVFSLPVIGASQTVASATTPPARSAGSQPQFDERYPRYVIQDQDTLSVSFPLSPELNQTITVQPDGFVSLQSAGSIHIQGFTVPQAIGAIKQAYLGILHNPIITIDLEDYQKPYFTVSGQVAKPGQYTLRTDTTVAEAVAVAGGLAPTAKSQVFLFHRTSQDWYKVTRFNMKDLLNGKRVDEDVVVRPGDMIIVPENFISKFRQYVPYGVSTGTFLNPY
ncbi:MAG TPA: polysaccharide biosynthesis/export family protein [Acidobacteriaceae bacterium]|jgi:polysaccharide export outer membrane protein|nr:polysaccharide biosynthesis/export family protein [Acidobacteriaceae bacterium]